MRHGLLIALLSLGLAACDKTETTEGTKDKAGATAKQENGEDEHDEEAADQAEKGTDEGSTAAEKPGGSFSVTPDFFTDKKVEDAKADAWARVRGKDEDELRIYLASDELDATCNLRETVGPFGKKLKKGQFALEFETYDPLGKEKTKQPFEGKPGTFDHGKFHAYYYSPSFDKGTNSGFGADDKHDVVIEIEEATDEYVSGTAKTSFSRGTVSAEFTAKFCE